MFDIIKILSHTSLPEILAFAGIIFIFLSIGGKLGAQIITDNIPKRYAAILGSILLTTSLCMFVVSATTQLKDFNDTKNEQKKDEIIKSDNLYKLRPDIQENQPISQAVELEWTYSSKENSDKCTLLSKTEDIYTILGHDQYGDISVSKRKTISDITKETCTVNRTKEPKVTITHGGLEGVDLLAHKTEGGIWIFDEFPGITEKQKYEMRTDGFIEPFCDLPKEKVPVGKVILLKDQDISLLFGTALPGKKEGTIAIKFDHVILEKEPIAQLSVSMDVSMTMLTENNEEIYMTMILNGGGRLSLSENRNIIFIVDATGVLKVGLPDSQNIFTGPATMKLIVKKI